MTEEYPRVRPPVDTNFQKVTSPFGMRMHPVTGQKKFHYGIDYAIPIGSNVYSSTYGECVMKREEETGFGKWLLIHSVFPENNQNVSWFFFYTHLSKFNIEYGSLVKPGQIIGLSGDTGCSTGAHLHFQVCKESASKDLYEKYAVDPNFLLEKTSGKADNIARLRALAEEMQDILRKIDDRA